MKILVVLAIASAVAGCSEPSGQDWRSVGELSDGLKAKFVEISAVKAQDRATYEQAVSKLCRGEKICVVGFFLPGDRVPPTQPSKQFFASGGWGSYAPAAVWWSNSTTGATGFTKWDCEKACSAGAPLDALCGKGIAQAHSALLALASRAGMGEACKWPKTTASTVAASYIAGAPDESRKTFNRKAYDQMYASAVNGPDNPADCKRLRAKIDDSANQAQRTLTP